MAVNWKKVPPGTKLKIGDNTVEFRSYKRKNEMDFIQYIIPWNKKLTYSDGSPIVMSTIAHHIDLLEDADRKRYRDWMPERVRVITNKLLDLFRRNR